MELGIELRSALTQTRISVTSDMWTDNYKKHVYVCAYNYMGKLVNVSVFLFV